MVIEGERVVLRRLCKDDADALVQYGDNRSIWRNLRDAFPSPYTLDAARDWIETSTTVDEFRYSFAIAIDGEVTGMVGVIPKSEVHCKTAELGYWIGEPFWGRGLVTEAVGLICQFAFSELGVARVEAYVYEWNPASGRVLEKNGFELEGRQRKSVFKDGELIDQFVYAKVSP